MIEIEVQNFQSIEKLALNIDRFATIVGRSNIGKSAIVRALQCALTGATGTDFVRHRPDCERLTRGNKKCKCQASVMIKTAKLKLFWEKGDAINQYTVWQDGETGEGTVYSKIDRGTPDFLLPDFEPVKVGKDSELIQVSEQFAPIFLLDQSGNTVADVLSDVAQLDQVNVAMGLVSKDRKSALATRRIREKDILDLVETLTHFDGLDQAVTDVQGVESSFKAVEGAQEAVERLDGYVDTLGALTASVAALGAATALDLPVAPPLRESFRKRSELDRFYQAVAERAPVVRRLSGIHKVALPDTGPIEGSADRLDRLVAWLASLRDFKAEIPGLKKLDKASLPEPLPVREALDQSGALRSFLDKQARLEGAVPELEQALAMTEPEPLSVREAVDKTKALQSLLDKQDRLEGAVPELEQDLAAAETEEAAILAEINELGVCPTCCEIYLKGAA